MGQRLGIAVALLGDPHPVMLDEPVNGLDPDGIKWIRHLLKDLAAQGRTVFISSHLMSEMALTAEHLIVVGRGRLIADTSVAELIESARRGVHVRTVVAGQAFVVHREILRQNCAETRAVDGLLTDSTGARPLLPRESSEPMPSAAPRHRVAAPAVRARNPRRPGVRCSPPAGT